MKPRILVLTICLSSAALMLAPTAHAETLAFGATLSGANEVPPTSSLGTGTVTVILDTTAQTLELKESFSNLTSNTTAAHIHCCQPPNNVGVATEVPTFPTFPLGVTGGTFDGILDLTMPSSYNPMFSPRKGH